MAYFNIILLGIASFLNDVSSELIAPILPIFITTLGGTGFIVGLIGGLKDSIASLLKIFAGFWADKSGKRKIFVSSGYFTSSLFKLLLPFSRIWPHVLIFSAAERVGKGLRTAPRDAMIADSVFQRRRGKGFGIHRALDTGGAIVGSGLALISFIILFALYGLFYACVDGNQRAFVSDLVPHEVRATALGVFHTSMGIAVLVASLIAGSLWMLNPGMTFGFGSLMSAVAIIGLALS